MLDFGEAEFFMAIGSWGEYPFDSLDIAEVGESCPLWRGWFMDLGEVGMKQSRMMCIFHWGYSPEKMGGFQLPTVLHICWLVCPKLHLLLLLHLVALGLPMIPKFAGVSAPSVYYNPCIFGSYLSFGNFTLIFPCGGVYLLQFVDCNYCARVWNILLFSPMALEWSGSPSDPFECTFYFLPDCHSRSVRFFMGISLRMDKYVQCPILIWYDFRLHDQKCSLVICVPKIDNYYITVFRGIFIDRCVVW